MAGFTPGNTVVLKCGSPLMCVDHVDPKTGVHCKWFDGKVLKTGTFKAEMLKPEEPPKPPITGVTMIFEKSPHPQTTPDPA